MKKIIVIKYLLVSSYFSSVKNQENIENNNFIEKRKSLIDITNNLENGQNINNKRFNKIIVQNIKTNINQPIRENINIEQPINVCQIISKTEFIYTERILTENKENDPSKNKESPNTTIDTLHKKKTLLKYFINYFTQKEPLFNPN